VGGFVSGLATSSPPGAIAAGVVAFKTSCS
jgi:hypothetical protein